MSGVAAETAQTRELLRQHIEQVWGRGDRALLRELYAPEVVDHAPMPGQAPGVAGLEQVMDAFSTAFPDLALTLESVLADGTLGSDRWTLRAAHLGPFLGLAPTGRRVEITGMDVVRVASGRIVEVWHTEDLASALRQLTA